MLEIKVQVRMARQKKDNHKRHVRRNRRDSVRNSGIARSCSMCTSSIETAAASRVYDKPCRRDPIKTKSYRRIEWGLKKSNPAAIVCWVFHKIPSNNGLTARTIISFLKTRYTLISNPLNVGKCIGSMLRCAVEFGLLQRRGDKYFLKRKIMPLT